MAKRRGCQIRSVRVKRMAILITAQPSTYSEPRLPVARGLRNGKVKRGQLMPLTGQLLSHGRFGWDDRMDGAPVDCRYRLWRSNVIGPNARD